MLRCAWVMLVLTLAGCGPYPRDVEGTLDRVERSHVMTVGMAAIDPRDAASAKAYLGRVARATGSQPQIASGSAERLLAQLEAGELDLVIGEFADDSPWLQSVALIEPISIRAVGERTVGLAPVAANGENRWVGLLEREVRDMREAPK